LGGRKGNGWRVKISLDIGGLYIPLGGLSLLLNLKAVATFGSHYFPCTITIVILLFIAHWI
jgi:hypothetical protein